MSKQTKRLVKENVGSCDWCGKKTNELSLVGEDALCQTCFDLPDEEDEDKPAFSNESKKGSTMKKLTERELNLLETLMMKETRAKKAGKKLSMNERVKLAVLKRNLKKQMENADDGFGETVPNEGDGMEGFEAHIAPEDHTEMTGGTNGLMDSKKRAAKIKSIKEKILASRRKREANEEHEMSETPEEEMMEDDEASEDQENIGLDTPATIGDIVDALVAGAEGGEDEMMESVRQRARIRREKLAKIRKTRMGEVEQNTPVFADQPDEELILNNQFYSDINKRPEIITHSEAVRASNRKRRVEAIRRKIATLRAQREAEVKTFQNGVVKGNGADQFVPSEGAAAGIEKKAPRYPESFAKAEKKMTEKLDFSAMLKKGILG